MNRTKTCFILHPSPFILYHPPHARRIRPRRTNPRLRPLAAMGRRRPPSLLPPPPTPTKRASPKHPPPSPHPRHGDAAAPPSAPTDPHNLHIPYAPAISKGEPTAPRAANHPYRKGGKVLPLPAMPF